MLIIQTRSGQTFSPWVGEVIRIDKEVNLTALVSEAVIRESLTDAGDDVPKYCDVLNYSPPPSPLPANTLSLPNAEPEPASVPETHCVANTGAQSTEKLRRKMQGKKKRALRRAMEKDAAEHGAYSIKPALVNKHIRTAKNISTSLNASKLRHTNTAYGGIAGESGGKVHRLEELVGEGSRFKFKLQRWDGRWCVLMFVTTPILTTVIGRPSLSPTNAIVL